MHSHSSSDFKDFLNHIAILEVKKANYLASQENLSNYLQDEENKKAFLSLINKNFQRLALTVHPDKNPHASETEKYALSVKFGEMTKAKDAIHQYIHSLEKTSEFKTDFTFSFTQPTSPSAQPQTTTTSSTQSQTTTSSIPPQTESSSFTSLLTPKYEPNVPLFSIEELATIGDINQHITRMHHFYDISNPIKHMGMVAFLKVVYQLGGILINAGYGYRYTDRWENDYFFGNGYEQLINYSNNSSKTSLELKEKGTDILEVKTKGAQKKFRNASTQQLAQNKKFLIEFYNSLPTFLTRLYFVLRVGLDHLSLPFLIDGALILDPIATLQSMSFPNGAVMGEQAASFILKKYLLTNPQYVGLISEKDQKEINKIFEIDKDLGHLAVICGVPSSLYGRPEYKPIPGEGNISPKDFNFFFVGYHYLNYFTQSAKQVTWMETPTLIHKPSLPIISHHLDILLNKVKQEEKLISESFISLRPVADNDLVFETFRGANDFKTLSDKHAITCTGPYPYIEDSKKFVVYIKANEFKKLKSHVSEIDAYLKEKKGTFIPSPAFVLTCSTEKAASTFIHHHTQNISKSISAGGSIKPKRVIPAEETIYSYFGLYSSTVTHYQVFLTKNDLVFLQEKLNTKSKESVAAITLK